MKIHIASINRFILTYIIISTNIFSLSAQQWSGSSDASGNLWRNGNVGIGTNDPSSYKLNVNGYFHSNGIDELPTYPYTKSFTNGADAGTVFIQAGSTSNYVSKIIVAGRTAGNGIQFITRSNEIMRVSDDGKVGIGTTTPSEKLVVAGNLDLPLYNNWSYIKNTATLGGIKIGTSDGSGVYRDCISMTSGGEYVRINQNLYLGNYHESIKLCPGGDLNHFINYSSSLDGLQMYGYSGLAFGTNTGEKVRILGNGNVLIGKSSQNNPVYKLDIEGKIRANEVVVNTTGADFVFAPEYNLPTLFEVEKFIKENNHLPDMAPASEMKENGMNVSEIQTKLLQKIEELTVYLINQDKAIEELKQNLYLQNQKMEVLLSESK